MLPEEGRVANCQRAEERCTNYVTKTAKRKNLSQALDRDVLVLYTSRRCLGDRAMCRGGAEITFPALLTRRRENRTIYLAAARTVAVHRAEVVSQSGDSLFFCARRGMCGSTQDLDN
jgi:hypothetical protein